jgi:hypothetical protein
MADNKIATASPCACLRIGNKFMRLAGEARARRASENRNLLTGPADGGEKSLYANGQQSRGTFLISGV